MRLIDADAVVAKLDKVCTTDDLYGMGIAAGISRAMMAMDNAPTIEAEPVRHGRWEKLGEADYGCSECGFRFTSGDPISMFPYCRCGAKMEG